MLANFNLVPSLAVSDIERAKAWYSEKLDLKPTEVLADGGAYYQSGTVKFLLYPSGFAGTNQATAAGWEVDDVDAVVADLQSRGVVFEEYDFDELKTVNGVATTPEGQKAAWFKDSEGNILGVFQQT